MSSTLKSRQQEEVLPMKGSMWRLKIVFAKMFPKKWYETPKMGKSSSETDVFCKMNKWQD